MLPQATSSMEGSIHFITLADSSAGTAVFLSRFVADLPRATHLVAQAPGFDAMGRGMVGRGIELYAQSLPPQLQQEAMWVYG